jgi:hypothetical protein
MRTLAAVALLALVCSMGPKLAFAQDIVEEDIDVVYEDEGDEIMHEQAPPQMAQRGPRPHPLTNLAPSHPDVETAFSFVKHDQQRLPAGEGLTILCGFVNEGTMPLNVSGIIGSLNSAQSFGQYYHNFTAQPVDELVMDGAEATFQYQFVIPMGVQEGDYQIALTAFYASQDGSMGFTSTFFNETVGIYEPAQPMDTKDIISYAVVILAAVWGLHTFGDQLPFAVPGVGKAARPSIAAGKAGDADFTPAQFRKDSKSVSKRRKR